MSESIKKIITHAKFNHLMKFRGTWSEKDEADVQAYLESRSKPKELPKGYFDEKPKPKPIEKLNIGWLAQQFKKQWELTEQKELIVTEENAPFYRLITQYFAKNPEFENSPLTENSASLDKGLLLIGGVGCGKTSMMRAFHNVGLNLYKQRNDTFMYFRMRSCNELVREFESLEHNEKESFFRQYITGKVYFDDFGTEPEASNFGKRNLMKDILEERYLKGHICHLTTNLTLEEIEQKYGFRVYDRIKEMFNVIIMPGESFRK